MSNVGAIQDSINGAKMVDGSGHVRNLKGCSDLLCPAYIPWL